MTYDISNAIQRMIDMRLEEIPHFDLNPETFLTARAQVEVKVKVSSAVLLPVKKNCVNCCLLIPMLFYFCCLSSLNFFCCQLSSAMYIVQLTFLAYLPTCLPAYLSTCLPTYLPTHLYSSPLCTTCHTLLILLRGLHHHLRCRTACSRCTEGCCLLRWHVNMMKVMYLRSIWEDDFVVFTSSAVATVVEEASKETATTSTSSSSTSAWDFTDELVFLHTPLSWHLKIKQCTISIQAMK